MEPPDLPDRQSREYRVESSRKKYFASRLGRNSFIDSVVPFPQEGRLAIVTDVGYGMRWTRQRQAQSLRGRMMLTRTAKSCGPGAPTLALRFAGLFLRSDGGKRARSPGRSRRKPLKP